MTLTLSAQASKALESICDTFVPGDDGLPSASAIGVPEAIQMAVGENPSEAEREGFAGLLDAWDTQLAGTEESPFSSLGQAEREAHAAGAGGRARGADARGLPGAAQGRAADLLLPPAGHRRPESGRRVARLSGAARAAVEPAAEDHPAARDHRRHGDRVRRLRRRLGRRRRRRGRCAGRGRARRRRRRGRRLLQRGGLRRRRAVRLRAAVPERRRRGERRPEHRPARRLVPGRRHGRQLHLVLPAARPRARRVEGRARARGLGGAGLRRQPRRGLGADLDQRREQHPVGARPRDAQGAVRARLALRGDAAQLQGLHRGGLPPLPLRLPDRRQAVDAQDVAPGRLRQRCADRRQHARRPRPDRGRPGPRRRGPHRRRAQADRPRPRGRAGRGRDPHAGDHGPLRHGRPAGRQEPDAAPGADHLGHLRRGGQTLGRHARSDLLRRAAGPRRGLRHQVRAGRDAAEHPGDLRALARRERVRRADALAPPHGRLRSAPAGARRRRDPGRRGRHPGRALGAVGLRPRGDAQGPRRRRPDPRGRRRAPDLLLARGLGLLRAGPQRRPRALPRRRRPLRLGRGPGDARARSTSWAPPGWAARARTRCAIRPARRGT